MNNRIVVDKEKLLNEMRLNTVIMHDHTNPHYADNGIFLTKIIELFDAAQPIQPNTAKWEEIEYTSISNGEVVSTPSVRCTACKKSDARWYIEMNYCPNCGAKMEEK